jgi:hypothetical protein
VLKRDIRLKRIEIFLTRPLLYKNNEDLSKKTIFKHKIYLLSPESTLIFSTIFPILYPRTPSPFFEKPKKIIIQKM